MDHSLSNLVIQLDPANFNSAAYFDFLYFELNLTISFGKLSLTNSSYFPDPHTEVYCFRLNFDVRKLVYLNYSQTRITKDGYATENFN